MPMDEHVMVVTAADLAGAETSMGQLESLLVNMLAYIKRRHGGLVYLTRIDYTPDVGGFELRCRRLNLLGRFIWWLSKPVELWR